jgi:hypothetical protein
LVLSVSVGLAVSACAGDGEATNLYVGAEKCKSCHGAASKGDQHGAWLKADHHKAFETLAGEEAKKIAKAKNIEDPQKDKACAVCHVTAFEAPAAAKGKKFDPTQGVQCESCHGPAGNHVKARLADEDAGDKVVKVKEGEILHSPGPQTCVQCHNENSPNYKKFDYTTFVKKIAHPDPRRNHPADYLDKLGETVKDQAPATQEGKPKTEDKK